MSKTIVKELLNMENGELSDWLENVSINDFWSILYRALLEQDRNTRHACAKEVIDFPREDDNILISVNLAHALCINTRAGVEDVRRESGNKT